MQDLIERRAALTALCEDCLRKYDGICPHPASRCVEFRTIKQLPEIKPLTNADRIRQMTDEELAEWLDTVIGCCSLNDCKYCPMYGACTDVPISMLRWLRKEADNGCEEI